jgi:mRNA interferase MazF
MSNWLRCHSNSIDGQRVLGLLGILEDNYWQQIQDALSIVCGFGIE